MPVPVVTIYITAPHREEALAIARGLIEARLIACANIIDNVTSVYRWNKEIAEDSEVALIGKTTEQRLPEILSHVKAHHSYDCPCITSWPLTAGSEDYLNWVRNEVAS